MLCIQYFAVLIGFEACNFIMRGIGHWKGWALKIEGGGGFQTVGYPTQRAPSLIASVLQWWFSHALWVSANHIQIV